MASPTTPTIPANSPTAAPSPSPSPSSPSLSRLPSRPSLHSMRPAGADTEAGAPAPAAPATGTGPNAAGTVRLGSIEEASWPATAAGTVKLGSIDKASWPASASPNPADSNAGGVGTAARRRFMSGGDSTPDGWEDLGGPASEYPRSAAAADDDDDGDSDSRRTTMVGSPVVAPSASASSSQHSSVPLSPLSARAHHAGPAPSSSSTTAFTNGTSTQGIPPSTIAAAAAAHQGLGIGIGGFPGAAGYPGADAAKSAVPDEVVPTTFDEGVLRALCDLDCGKDLLLDRIKQSMVSCREASVFFKKRAAVEEEYARSLAKLAKGTAEAYGMNEGKAGTYVTSWMSFLRTHETVADNRLRFAAKLSEMSDELTTLVKEVDKSRKASKEIGQRMERTLVESEMATEKARARFDQTAEDLERVLVLKSGESMKESAIHPGQQSGGGKRTLGKAIAKGGNLFKGKNPQQMLRQEEEARARTSTASDAFRQQVLSTQKIRQEYFNLQLPRVLRALKETAEEIDNGTQYHLTRYAFLYESISLSDGMSISPVSKDDGIGLKAAVEAIDNRADFKVFMQNYAVASSMGPSRGPRREGPFEQGFVENPPVPRSRSKQTVASQQPPHRPIFGVELSEQMLRDNVEVPLVLVKCAQLIEAHGLQTTGIYRLSGTTSKVQRLKAKLDADVENIDLGADEAVADINNVSGVLKLWFRELPEPLLTFDLYQGFIDAAKIENERLRQIRLHERVNELPDANYATLKFLMSHLDKVKEHEAVNSMSASNLAIVFGPTLLSPPPSEDGGTGAMSLQDMTFQCRAVETVLNRYREIFVDENE